MERREFIIGTAALCCSTTLISLSGCVNYKYVSAGEENGRLKISKSDFAENKFVLVKSMRTNAPIYLSKSENNFYTALLMLCTHKQCELKPQGSALVCPCHGSEFSNSGKVLKEPADKDLVQYETSSDGNNIYIYLK